MKAEDKVKKFENELVFIKNEDIKKYVKIALENVPDYFFSVPASSTGRYHPSYALGEGGLYRHTKACIKIAVELFRLEMFNYFNNDEKDIILASLILHDTRKSGDIQEKYTRVDHPILAKMAIENDEKLQNARIISDEYQQNILENISKHMGQWISDPHSGEIVLEKPKTKMQNFVHLIDYLASRKFIEINFSA